MDIASMLVREDFYTILQETLRAYYRQVHNRDIRVEYTPFEGCETLYIYSRLSFIARKKVPCGAREFLYSEFNIRGNLIKYFAGKLLVFLAVHSGGRGATRKLYITRGALGKNAFISPQNRSIRIFDYDAMTVDCIVKSSFTSTYFNNQLAFRTQYHYPFVPPILATSEGWFREHIMRGNPLARVTNNEAYKAAQSCVIQYIGELASDTVQLTSSAEYMSGLIKDVYAKLGQAESEKKIASAPALKTLVRSIEERISDMPIPLVRSHGDLQSGNIWLETDGRVWIYDWETQKTRSIWYDCVTLLYSTRRAGGLERFMSSPDISLAFANDDRTERTPQAVRLIKDVVLLEDMLFYLEDMLELPGLDGAEIFERFAARVLNLPKGV